MKKHINKITAFLLIAVAVLSMTMTGCNKDKQPDQRTPITVQVKTEGLKVSDLKSFDLNTWQYNYNQNQYELTFTGTGGNIYTFNKSISEMAAGFEITVIQDNYNITYEAIHTPTTNAPLDDKIDIVINENQTITNNSNVVLHSFNNDFMILMDVNPQGAYLVYNTNQFATFFDAPIVGETYKYAYYNQEGQVIIQFVNEQGQTNYITIPNAIKNKCYHVISGANGQISLEITDFDYEIILN
jgi:hypothetical protein